MAYCIFKEGDVHRVATRRGETVEYGRGGSRVGGGCSRHLACCGFLFLVLCQASGCGDNASPPAPTPPPVAANHSPVASAAVIPDQALPVGRNAATVDMAPYFTDLDGDTLTYTVVSSDAGVVTASVSGSTVTLTPVSAGATTVAVTAMDPGGGDRHTVDRCDGRPRQHAWRLGSGCGVSRGKQPYDGSRGGVHVLDDGTERRGRGRSGHDAALLLVDGCDDLDIGHGGGHGYGGRACGFGKQ